MGLSAADFLSYGESSGGILLENEIREGKAEPKDGEKHSPNDTFLPLDPARPETIIC